MISRQIWALPRSTSHAFPLFYFYSRRRLHSYTNTKQWHSYKISSSQAAQLLSSHLFGGRLRHCLSLSCKIYLFLCARNNYVLDSQMQNAVQCDLYWSSSLFWNLTMSDSVGGGSNFSSTIIDAQPIRIISMVAGCVYTWYVPQDAAMNRVD